MSRKKVMSDALKYEFASELGIAPTRSFAGDDYAGFETASELALPIGPTGNHLQTIDWGSVSSRDCGNLVKMAIEKASRSPKMDQLL